MMVALGQMRHKRSIRWWLMRPVSSWGGSDLIHAVEEVPLRRQFRQHER